MSKVQVVKLMKQAEPQVIEVLEGALERARKGDTRGLALVELMPNGCFGSVYAFGDDSRPYLGLLGALQVLTQRIIGENS